MNRQEYINQLLLNISDEMRNKEDPLVLDIILDGGAFNGSYLIGALQFLNAMEEEKWIKINRLSGASIGSLCAVLYYYNALDEFSNLYKDMYNQAKTKRNFNTMEKMNNTLKDIIIKSDKPLPNNILFISYWNIKKNKKIIAHTFKDVDDLINTINRSCFLPFFINGNMLYNKKYIDGMVPYLFPFNQYSQERPNKDKHKMLHLNLIGRDKIHGIMNIKNELTNFQRIFAGALDIHYFFVKKKPTQLCKFITESDMKPLSFSLEYIIWKLFYCFEFIIVFIIRCLYLLAKFTKYMKHNKESSSFFYYGHIFVKLFNKIFKECAKTLVELLCF